MLLHRLHFKSKDALSEALSRLMACPRIEDCIVDLTALTVAFSAPAEDMPRLLGQLHRGAELPRWSFIEAV